MRSRVPTLLLFLASALLSHAAGPPVAAPDYAQTGVLDQAAGRAALDQFRAAAPDRCYFEFELRILPRRGEERSVPGRIWWGRDEQGPVMRIVLQPGTPEERRWLVQDGAAPGIWRSLGSAPARPAGLLDPLFPGVEISAFDLQMPFLYWPDETLLSVNRVRGRPANTFAFRPPAAFAAAHPAVAGIRAAFDTQFNFPLQIETLGAAAVLKTLSVVDGKRVEDQEIPKEIDVRNELTRDKTRFEVTAVALHLDLPPALFLPADLDRAVAPPAEKQLTRFGP